MELFYKCKGSVSIFLVIILVPVIVVCSVFVDASRIKLARSLVNSAGDLTLTTAMSYYDLELNDYYGLLASSQSEEEFFANSQAFFEACMVSQGIETTDAKEWAETLRQIAEGDSDIVDLLQIEVVGGYSLESVEGANLANATMLKNGIVDFMKYRAPIELLAEGNNIIKKFEDIGKKEEIIPIETKLQDEKQDYYEAESEVLRICGDIYLDFVAYDDLGMTEQKLRQMKAELDKLKDEYQELHTLTVKNLYNGENKGGFRSVKNRMIINPDGGTYSDTGKDVLISLITDCRNKITDYESKKTTLQNKINTIPFKDYQSTYYDIQYWIQMESAISKEYEDYIKSMNAMLTAQARLQNAYENREVREEEWGFEEEIGEDGEIEIVYKQIQEAYDVKDEYSGEAYATIEVSYNDVNVQVDAIKNSIKNSGVGVISKISDKMQEISDIADRNGTMKSDPVTKRLEEISLKIKAYEDDIKECDKLLKEIYKNLGELEKAVKKYDEEYAEWKGMAEANSQYAQDSNIVETDLHEISVLEGQTAPTGDDDDNQLERVKINLEEVHICRDRVNNVRSLFGSYTSAMDSFTYGGEKLKDIKTYKTLKKKSGIEESKIVIDNSSLETYARESFEAVFVQPAETDYHNITDNNNPQFTINQPAFYEWLHQKFDGKNLKDKGKAKGVLDKLKEKMEEEKKNHEKDSDSSEISGNEIADQEGRPSKEGASGSALGNTGGESVEEVGNTTSLFDGLNLKDILISGRDNLYGTSYIMSMFTYDTYQKENLYQLCRGENPPEDIYQAANQTKLNPASCKTEYDSFASAWQSKDTTFTANKTLTNKMRNQENNFSFGNEVEYIIYGGTNAQNKLASYGTIFGIRYAMNIGPVFAEYWNDKVVISVSTTISAATSGIIPVSLIKLVICLGVTAAETAVDISYLKAGLPVLFIKGKNDLFLQLELENLADGATELAGGITSKDKTIRPTSVVLSYSDYLTLFLFIAISMNEQSVYLRTADVIQCNMGLRHEMKYRMKDADVYYALTADIRVKPIMLALPWATENGSDILDSSNWNVFQIQQIRGY